MLVNMKILKMTQFKNKLLNALGMANDAGGPPDLDQVLRDLNQKISGFFGKKPSRDHALTTRWGCRRFL